MKLTLRSILAMVCILASLNALGSTTTLGKQFVTYGVNFANQKYDGFAPTAIEAATMAEKITAYAKAAKADGTLAAAESALLKNKASFVNAAPDSKSIYKGLVSVGWKGTQSEVDGWIQSSDAQSRRALVNKIAAEGLYGLLTDVAGRFRMASKSLASRSQGVRFLNASYQPASLIVVGWSPIECSTAEGTGVALALLGGVSALTGNEPLAAVLEVVGGGFLMMRWFECN